MPVRVDVEIPPPAACVPPVAVAAVVCGSGPVSPSPLCGLCVGVPTRGSTAAAGIPCGTVADLPWGEWISVSVRACEVSEGECERRGEEGRGVVEAESVAGPVGDDVETNLRARR